MRSHLALFEGDYAKAEQAMDAALPIGERVQKWDAQFSYRTALFGLRRAQGRLAEVEELIRRSADEYRGYRSFRCLVPLIAAELGRIGEARELFVELASDDFETLPRDNEWLFNLCVLAEVAVRVLDSDRAYLLYHQLLPYGQFNALAAGELAIGSVARYLGLLAWTLSLHHEAARHFEAALEMNDRMDGRPWLAYTQFDYGRMLRERGEPGDRERSKRLTSDAIATSLRLGMTHPATAPAYR
jgi:tetratricopeptide (TPR) repeat protein